MDESDSKMSTTEKLLNAAEHRMRRGGYNAVSFRDLANDTNIKSSSVHYHYPKKEDLGTALVDRYSKRFFDTLNVKTENATTMEQKLKVYQSIIRSALVEDDAICLCGLLGAEGAGIPDVVANGVQNFFDENIKWLVSILPQEMSESQKSSMASTLLAGHQGAMMLARSMQDNKIFDTITNQLIKEAI